MSKTPEQIVALVRQAGVIGAAGTGYPTHVKLEARAETVILNGCECEPLVHTDKTLLATSADDVVRGLRVAMTAVGAREGVIAINCEDHDGIRAVRAVIEAMRDANSGANVTVHLMGNYYPAGDELLTVYDVTGKVVPEGANPLAVGVLVLNVLTARQIYQAVNGIAATERAVTIAGAVREPRVVTVPIGTRYSELVALAGGFTSGLRWADVTVLEGGPMMGQPVWDLEQGISKSTGALVVLPTSHYVVQMKLKPIEEVARQSKAVSGQRTQSTDLCPRHLLGHAIRPHEALMALDYSRSEPSDPVTSAYLCSDCGICELVGDEASFISPRKVYREFKKRLQQAGVANPHHRSGFPVHSQFQNRKLSLPTLVMKLGIGDYVRKAAVSGKQDISLVRIPTSRHVGVAADPTVELGRSVRRGDVIAESPADQLGTVYHAPIHGKVSDITDHYIEITGAVS